MVVECVIEDPRWAKVGLGALAEEAAAETLRALDLAPGAWEISLLACDDARISELNVQFRDKAGPTNVLSWPSADRAPEAPGARPPPPDPDDPALGDIALAYETCLREAETGQIPFAAHIRHLIVHGILHLLGYDHETDADATRMENLEIEILARLGVPDPY